MSSRASICVQDFAHFKTENTLTAAFPLSKTLYNANRMKKMENRVTTEENSRRWTVNCRRR